MRNSWATIHRYSPRLIAGSIASSVFIPLQLRFSVAYPADSNPPQNNQQIISLKKTPTKCAIESSNATLFANAFISNTQLTPALPIVNAVTLSRKRPSWWVMRARFTLRAVPLLRLLPAAGRTPDTLVPRNRDGDLFYTTVLKIRCHVTAQ